MHTPRLTFRRIDILSAAWEVREGTVRGIYGGLNKTGFPYWEVWRKGELVAKVMGGQRVGTWPVRYVPPLDNLPETVRAIMRAP